MTSFDFAIMSPERTAFEGEATTVNLRSEGGEIGILAGHVPYVGAVATSVCQIERPEGGDEKIAVHGGFVEVDPEGKVTLLADIAELPKEIDKARARRAMEETEREPPGADEGDREKAARDAAHARAVVRLQVAGELDEQ